MNSIRFTVPEDNVPHWGTITHTYCTGKHVVLDHTAQAKGEQQCSRFVFAPQIISISEDVSDEPCKNLR